jgi:hypothetical protein
MSARARKAANVFIVAWLVLQFALPIRGFVRGKHDTRGDFSWNMYASQFRVDERYVVITPDGRGVRLKLGDYFVRSGRWTSAFHRDTLPAFNAWLCDELPRRGLAGTLVVRARVSENGGPYVDLVTPNAHACEVEGYAVLPP